MGSCLRSCFCFSCCLILLLKGSYAGGCARSCTSMEAGRERCVLWHILAKLDLKEDMWIKHTTCDEYAASGNDTWPDFVNSDDTEWRTSVEQINLTGRVNGGTLAPETGEFYRLLHFRCSGCNLSGTLPKPWTGWYSLTQLDLSNNRLEGEIPQGWSLYGWPEKGSMLMNFSNNPQLGGSHVPWLYSSDPRPKFLDISNTNIHWPFDMGVLRKYCAPLGAPVLSVTVIGDEGFNLQERCRALNFRMLAQVVLLVFLGFTLVGVAAVQVYGRFAASGKLPRGHAAQHASDPEVVYSSLPSSLLTVEEEGEAFCLPRDATGMMHSNASNGFGSEGKGPPAPTPRHPVTYLLVALTFVQMGLNGRHLSGHLEWRSGSWLWLPMWFLPQLLCATVLVIAMFRGQALWIKVGFSYIVIPAMAGLMPFTWLLAEVTALGSQPVRASYQGVLQVVFSMLLLPLLLVLLPAMLLLFLVVLFCSWPPLDFSALVSCVASVFEKLKANSHTHISMLHWTVGLGQAPLATLLLIYNYFWNFNYNVYFDSKARRRLMISELCLTLTNFTLHILVLVYSLQPLGGFLGPWGVAAQLKHSQINFKAELTANQLPDFIRNQQESSATGLGDGGDSQGLLQSRTGRESSDVMQSAVALAAATDGQQHE